MYIRAKLLLEVESFVVLILNKYIINNNYKDKYVSIKFNININYKDKYVSLKFNINNNYVS